MELKYIVVLFMCLKKLTQKREYCMNFLFYGVVPFDGLLHYLRSNMIW